MRVLIVGSDGLIGHALSLALRERGHEVIGTTRRANPTDASLMFLDLEADQLAPLPPADVMVLCAAVSKFAACRDKPELAHRVNVEARVELARAMRRQGGRTIALSSSAVFDCTRPFARAEWAPSPRSAYGRMMAEAETGVLAEGGAIFRLTKVITADTGVLRHWIAGLQSGASVLAFADHTFCPLPLSDVVYALAAVIEQPDGGMFQISGASDISYAHAARHLADRIGVPSDRVVSVRAVDSDIPECEVTPFTSLDTSRLSALTHYQPQQPAAVIDAVYGLRADRAARIDA